MFIGYANNNDAYKFLVYKLYIPYIYIYIHTKENFTKRIIWHYEGYVWFIESLKGNMKKIK